jgi:hypothetical protein
MEIREDKSYRAYLVQCWQEGLAVWRFAAQPIGRDAARRGFRDLDDLVAFLRAELKQEKDIENVKRDARGE